MTEFAYMLIEIFADVLWIKGRSWRLKNLHKTCIQVLGLVRVSMLIFPSFLNGMC